MQHQQPMHTPNGHPCMVWLDRDGTINPQQTGKYVTSPDELRLFEHGVRAILLLQSCDLVRLAIVTNQAGLASGQINKAAYNEINIKLNAIVLRCGGDSIKVFTCPHAKDADCECRKPKSQLFMDSAKFFSLKPKGWVIGDSWRDIVAAKTLSPENMAILVETGEGRSQKTWQELSNRNIKPDYVESDVLAAARRVVDMEIKKEGVRWS